MPRPDTRTVRRYVPTAVAAVALGVTESTVRTWTQRGRLTRHGSPGRARYDLAELEALAAARHAQRGELAIARRM